MMADVVTSGFFADDVLLFLLSAVLLVAVVWLVVQLVVELLRACMRVCLDLGISTGDRWQRYA